MSGSTPAQHLEGHFSGCGGLPLFYQAWRPPGKARAVLVNLHGLGDHSSLYPTLAAHFPARNIALYAFDMRGNGRSSGQRGYVRDWDEFRIDLGAFLRLVERREPGLPIFLLGNSLGGLVVLDYALLHADDLAGVIAAAPPLGKLGVPAVLMTLGRLMSRLIPRFSLNVGMDLTGLARDPAVIAGVLADPLFHRKGTARLSTEVTAAIERVQAKAGELAVPLLLLHGSDDRMVPPDGTRSFFAKVRFLDRELKKYPGAYHGLFADLNYREVLADVEHWIERQLSKQAGKAETREPKPGVVV